VQRALIKGFCGGLLLITVAAIPAFGTTFTFNFNSLTGYSSSAGNQAASIASQLTTQLQTVCPTCSVVATGGSTAAVIDKTYTGEGYTVGPTSGGSVMPETLGDTPGTATIYNTAAQSTAANPSGTGLAGAGAFGNSQYSYSQLHTQGYTNQFLSNTNDSSSQLANEISFQFKGLTITGASFNFEAFPSASGSGFEFEAGNNTNGTDSVIFSQGGVTPSGSGSDGSSTRSTNDNPETNAQYIGSWSDISGGTGPLSATELDFVDWPPTIGIDNLTITFTDAPSGVPEPGSVALLGTAVLGAFLIARRKLQKA
jgi:PEP-CTERM motif